MSGRLVFVGLGLVDEFDISLRGIEFVKQADFVFAEVYTNQMPSLSFEKLREIAGKDIRILLRDDLEGNMGKTILEKAKSSQVVFLVPGDPFVATTHIDLRILAEKNGISTHVVHGTSIVSAAMSVSGLQNYRFGKSVTIPFVYEEELPQTPLDVIGENKSRDLHTLCFLDIDAEKSRFMTVNESLSLLLSANKRRNAKVISLDTLAVGLARIGWEKEIVKANRVRELINYDFGEPPHLVIFPADRLHFMEAEALRRFADAPSSLKEMI